MATYALVGTIGVASFGAATTAVTPAWGTSENRTANNLLICFVSVTASATLPTTPSGWSIAKQVAGTTCSATIYYKIAAGADAAPTINAITTGRIAAQLAEFSGNATSTPVDQTGSATGTSSPITATQAAADASAGELLLMCGADFRSTARAPNDTWTSNNATITQAGNNNGTSLVNHYSFGYSLSTTSKASADTAVMTISATQNITGLAVVSASFKNGPAIGTLDITLGAATTIADADTVATGNLSATFGALTLSSPDGDTVATGNATPFFGSLTLSADGSVSTPGPTGDLSVTLGSTTVQDYAFYAISQVSDLAASDQTAVGQFFPSVGGNLVKSAFYILRVGAPTGNAYAKLYAPGDGQTPGVLLATSNPVDVTTIPTTFTWFEFIFSGAQKYSMAAATPLYIIMLEHSGPDSSNCIQFYYGSPTDAGYLIANKPGGWNNFSRGLALGVVVSSAKELALSSAPDDSNTVALWLDRSPSRNNAAKIGNPIFKQGIVGGKPVVRLRSSSSDGFNLASALSSDAPWSCFMVMKPATPTSVITALGTNLSGGNSYTGLFFSDGNFYVSVKTGYLYWPSSGFNSDFHVLSVNHWGAASFNFRVDGVSTSHNPVGLTQTGDFDTIGHGPVGASLCDGDIAAIVFFPDQLNDTLRVTDRQNIEKTLSVKYGTPAPPAGYVIDISMVTGLAGWWEADSIGTNTVTVTGDLVGDPLPGDRHDATTFMFPPGSYALATYGGFTAVVGGKLLYALEGQPYHGGSNIGPIRVKIYTVSGGLPDVLLATSDPVDCSIIGGGDYTLPFSGENQITLVAGNQYSYVYEYTYTGGSGNNGLFYDDTAGLMYINTGGGWSLYRTGTNQMRLYVAGPGFKTLGILTAVGAASDPVISDVTQTLGALTLLSTAGSPFATADLSVTLGAATLSGSSNVIIKPNSSVIFGALIVSSADTDLVTANASITLGSVQLAGTGSISIKAVSGGGAGIGTQTITDNFNRADENPIAGNWTPSIWTPARIQILSNTAQPTASSVCWASYNPWSGGNDQYSQAEITALTGGSGGGVGVYVRDSGTPSVRTHYALVIDEAGSWWVYKFILGSFGGFLLSGTVTYVAGKKLGLSIQGTTLKAWYDGIQIGTTTDTDISTGFPCIGIGAPVTSGSMENWDAGTTGGTLFTLGSLQLSSTVSQTNLANLSKTLGALTLSSTDSETVTANLTQTLGPLSISSSTGNTVTGNLSTALGALSVVSTSSDLISGSLGITLGALSLTSNAVHQAATSDLSVTLGSTTLSATGAELVSASAIKTLGALTLSALGGSPAAVADLSVTLGSVTLNSAFTELISASAVNTFGSLTLSSTDAEIVSASAVITFGSLTLSASGGHAGATADLSATFGSLSITGSSSETIQGSVVTGFGALTGAGAASLFSQANLAATFGSITLSSSASVVAFPTGDAYIVFDPVTLGSIASANVQTDSTVLFGDLTLDALVAKEAFADLNITFGNLRTILPIGITEPIGGIDIIVSGMPIRPAPLNLTIVTGIIFGPVILRAKDLNNAPIDLTGWKPFAEVRKKPGSSVILDLAPILTDPPIGEITIPKWTDEQTYNLKLGNFVWSLILEDPFGDRRGPYMQGAFTITATPTKPPEGI